VSVPTEIITLTLLDGSGSFQSSCHFEGIPGATPGILLHEHGAIGNGPAATPGFRARSAFPVCISVRSRRGRKPNRSFLARCAAPSAVCRSIERASATRQLLDRSSPGFSSVEEPGFLGLFASGRICPARVAVREPHRQGCPATRLHRFARGARRAKTDPLLHFRNAPRRPRAGSPTRPTAGVASAERKPFRYVAATIGTSVPRGTIDVL